MPPPPASSAHRPGTAPARPALPSYLTRATFIALLATAGIAVYLALRFGAGAAPPRSDFPLYVVLAIGGSLLVVDELFHISRRMRRIALQSAVGGMALSVAGMLLAFAAYLPPVAGAVFQEVIDLAAVLNALRAGTPGGELSDY